MEKVLKDLSQLEEKVEEKAKETKVVEPVKEEKFIEGKLYGLYCVISNKTVRAHEKHYVRYYKKNKALRGYLCKTGRGYFIDGYNVDLKSVELWATANDGLNVVRSKK